MMSAKVDIMCWQIGLRSQNLALFPGILRVQEPGSGDAIQVPLSQLIPWIWDRAKADLQCLRAVTWIPRTRGPHSGVACKTLSRVSLAGCGEMRAAVTCLASGSRLPSAHPCLLLLARASQTVSCRNMHRHSAPRDATTRPIALKLLPFRLAELATHIPSLY